MQHLGSVVCFVCCTLDVNDGHTCVYRFGANNGQAVTVEGPLASALRRAAYWYRQPTAEQRLSVGASWLQQAATEGATLAQRVLSGQSSQSSRANRP